jgi:hypothetical protein
MSDLSLLLDAVTDIKNDVINSMQSNNRFATGETVAALEVTNNDSSVQLLAPLYVDALEFGRGPTSPDAIPGDPPMIERIKAWCAAKGIEDGAAWAIKKNIDKVGYPGKPGVLTEPLSDDNISRRITPATESIASDLSKRVADLFDLLEV